MNWQHFSADAREALAFPDLETCLALEGEEINSNPMSRLVRVQVGVEHYYVKSYLGRGRGIRRFLGRSRLRAESENLQFFERHGIPSATPVVFGESGRISGYRGVLVVRECKGARDLVTLSEEQADLFADSRWRGQIIRRLGVIVHEMHRLGFVHSDLKWRNILADATEAASVYIIDCPMGRRMFGPFLARGVIKDLACLDKVGRYKLSRTDRLRFYLASQGRQRLVPGDRKTIARIQGFFEGRE